MKLKKVLGLSSGRRVRRNPSGLQWGLIALAAGGALYGVSQLSQPAPASAPASPSGSATPPGGNNAAAGGSQTITVPTNIGELMIAAYGANGTVHQIGPWITTMQSVLPLSYNQWAYVYAQNEDYHARTGVYPSGALEYAIVLKATKIAS